ncbi:hypothetical protein BG015_011912 [Linnemannia schmuckeri]|uniref:Uncharacterized protein n=1 Tax=Linnemannia schmuckeri TaxID=64567 RepID=A0A9P5RS37_9FUNG|nr:hypothetical protein BG015_011912 [Linnemannia schmuckeri]
MHFSTSALFALTLVTLLSTTTAQWVNDATEACKSCLLAARNAQVPACKNIPANPQTGRMIREARVCQCGAASNDAWITSCTKPDACDAMTATILKRAYAGVKIGCDRSGLSSVDGSS